MTRTIRYRIRQHRDGQFYAQVRRRWSWAFLSMGESPFIFDTKFNTRTWDVCRHSTAEVALYTIERYHSELKAEHQLNKNAKFVTVKTVELTMEK